MNIKIYSLQDITKLIIVGKLAANILEMISEYIKPGINTEELNNICHKYIETKIKCSSATIGYKGFQHATCISINNVVCHGIPNYKTKLKTNDILNIDVTIIKEGYYADTSAMYIVGNNKNNKNNKNYNICKVTQECLYKAISIIRDGTKLSEVGNIIQTHAKTNGYSVVKEFCGHGIGTDFHLKPQVLNYNGYNNDILLKEGMCLTVEPMIINRGTAIKILKDGWTTITTNKSNSAQCEHTLIIKKQGVIITTIRKNEKL
ncbi:Methionine aminopeptidase [Candidatus Portiera aleyrodidarum]|uniref:Methionine aminopeptidase n=1 Tax=Candidatus Portiera aleyrodidarum TV TaxID=1297582 RepID=A0A8D3X754_9GAMM|nr:type I methionyl aminopeptidase [Candidatus Portiera aleyrodidarum]AGI27019.1 methionine aminopeptidase, type I [Candidatus Portiera aleyrodidarum TV]CEI58974.1 Methionine aminopeptidase [Candidatus Portiera aleyrodidarum]